MTPLTELSRFDFHHGEALGKVADTYSTLQDVIFESVQNALDSNAKKISVVVDFSARALVIEDDGDGASKVKFEEALTSVCCSIKERNKLGQFGIGLISPLGKCDNFTFTSTPKDNTRGYLQWTFDSNAIKSQKKITGIPVRKVPELYFDRKSDVRGAVPWRTQVRLVNFTKDKILSKLSLESLKDGLLSRFSITMRRLHTQVNILLTDGINPQITTVMADRYTGKKLPVFTYGSTAKKATFALYIANKTLMGRKGKVVVGEAGNDFRYPIISFFRQIRPKKYLASDVMDCLSSGLFEGEIVSDEVKLQANRKSFRDDESLFEFCVAFEEWYKNEGIKHVDKIREEMQDERYQLLGIQSLKVIESLLKQPQFEHLMKVIEGFQMGTIGSGHAKPSTNKVIGKQLEPASSIHGHEERPAKKPDVKSDSETEHVQHKPMTVTGPRGKQRTIVKSNSLGLQFRHEEMEGSDKLWELDTDCGILSFNIRHPIWAQCEKDEKALMKLQEYIAVSALHLETVPDDWKVRHRAMVDDGMPLMAFLFLRGDEIAGRKPGKKKQ